MTEERFEQLQRYHGDGRLDRGEVTELWDYIEDLRRAVSLAESVYRQNCVAEGEPSSLLQELQRVLLKVNP